jgi:glycosyltransferase involved in cell wall biosynthesis
VYCSHNLEFRTYLDKARKDPRRLPLAGYVYLAEKLAAKRCSVLVPITHGDAASYARWTNREKMVVVTQGFDPEVFHPFYEKPHNDPRRVLFCGNYKIRMNLDVVRVMIDRVIPEVVRRRPDTIFRFVGASPPRHLRHPAVEYTGFIEDYPEELKKADVVVSPIMEGAGFPTKIVEALACGKPTISTPVGARSVERDYETLRVCDLDEFPDRICAALERDTPVVTGDFEKVVERYAWEANLDRLVEAVDELIPSS